MSTTPSLDKTRTVEAAAKPPPTRAQRLARAGVKAPAGAPTAAATHRKAAARKPTTDKRRAVRSAKARVARMPDLAALTASAAEMAPAARPPPHAPVIAPRPGPRRSNLLRTASLSLVVLLLGLALVVGTVSSQPDANAGTIKVHDGAAAEPPTRNEPHVEGDVFVEGFNMAADEGTLQIFSWPPTGDMQLVVDTTWSADDGEPVHHFLAGPFILDCGHYRVEAQNGMQADDFPGGVKSKMFWVDCPPAEEPPCPEEPCEQPPCPEEPCEQPPCPEEPCGEPPVVLECPADLALIPQADGSILVTFTPAPGSDGTNVYRLDGDSFVYLDTVGAGATEYLDTTAVAGNGYTYTVTALFGNEESTACAESETTAIPEFPTVVAFGLAAGGGMLALAVSRRKA